MNNSAELRAEQSLGSSSNAILDMVRSVVRTYLNGLADASNIKLLDVGCGRGNLWNYVKDVVAGYEGVDILHYEGFPSECVFHQLNLDSGRAQLDDGYADIVVAVETIEHLENPRAFVRELVRLCKPGGLVVVTTPNQLSLLSKLTLVLKNHFNAFADSCYPAHITALLEIDLLRIAKESGLVDCRIEHSRKGRMPGSSISFPSFASKIAPRLFSDNVCLVARCPQK